MAKRSKKPDTQLQVANIVQPANPDTAKYAPKFIPIEKIRELIEVKELNTVQAAAILGCSAEAVRLRCINHGIKHGLKRWRETKADILASKQRQLLDSLDSGAIKSMAPGSRVTAFAILYDKERLERGQSTENVAYCDMSRRVSEMDAEIERLQRELGDQASAQDDNVYHNSTPEPEEFDLEHGSIDEQVDIIEDID